MKYSHREYAQACERLEDAKKAVPQANEALDAIEARVRGHFREVAKTYNYHFVFEKPERDGKVMTLLDQFEHEGDGIGVLTVHLPSETVMIADEDGALHKILERKGIPHTIQDATQARGEVNLDIAVATERLEEILSEYRKPGERYPEQKGPWEGRTAKHSTRSRRRG